MVRREEKRREEKRREKKRMNEPLRIRPASEENKSRGQYIETSLMEDSFNLRC